MKPVSRIVFGSNLYGTGTPESDLDFKSVHIPDVKDILLQRASKSIRNERPEKAEGEKNKPGDVDDESYSLQNFLQLAGEGQMGALDMLFAPKESILFDSGWWSYLVKNRNRFLSKRSMAFIHYCRAQANKYGIKGSRVQAATVAANSFEGIRDHGGRGLDKLGVWAGALEQLVREHPDHMAIVEQAVGSSGQLGLFFECCDRKVSYTASVNMAAQVFRKVADGYGDRARLAQENEGVDWKALSHAVRVGEQAVELLTTGHITLPRPNADFLRDIKMGAFPYEAVSSKIEGLLIEVEEATRVSTLPDEPDWAFIDATVAMAYQAAVLSDPLRLASGGPTTGICGATTCHGKELA